MDEEFEKLQRLFESVIDQTVDSIYINENDEFVIEFILLILNLRSLRYIFYQTKRQFLSGFWVELKHCSSFLMHQHRTLLNAGYLFSEIE